MGCPDSPPPHLEASDTILPVPCSQLLANAQRTALVNRAPESWVCWVCSPSQLDFDSHFWLMIHVFVSQIKLCLISSKGQPRVTSSQEWLQEKSICQPYACASQMLVQAKFWCNPKIAASQNWLPAEKGQTWPSRHKPALTLGTLGQKDCRCPTLFKQRLNKKKCLWDIYKAQLFQRFRTVEQIYTFKLIFNTLLTLAHPWYFGCSQDQAQINL